MKAGTLAVLVAATGGIPDRDAAAAQSVLSTAGVSADVIAGVGWVLFAGGTVIFVAVMALLAASLRSRRERVHTGMWVIGGGVVFPAVVLSALLAYSTVRTSHLSAATPADALVISVVGRMWWWEVRYRDPHSGNDIVTANEIRIPVGRPVHLGLTTTDVIHSFWVPALAGKIDMVPGRVNRLLITANAPGVYRGQCAEYCGEQHARMALHVVAETPAAFEAWLARQAQPAAPATSGMLERGRQAFLEQRCNACHAVRGVAEGAQLAPDLTHVGSRLYIGAGMLPTHRGTLAAWIADVQRIKPGARMPSFNRIEGETLAALAAYLEHLQ